MLTTNYRQELDRSSITKQKVHLIRWEKKRAMRKQKAPTFKLLEQSFHFDDKHEEWKWRVQQFEEFE